MTEEIPDQRLTTWRALAEALEVTEKTLIQWRRIPGSPITKNVEAWKRFMSENELGIVGNRVTKDREELLKEKLAEEIRLLKTKNAKEERTVVDRAAVDDFLLHVATLQKTILYQRLGREAGPKCEGKTAAEITVFLTAVADEIADIFTNGLEQWKSA